MSRRSCVVSRIAVPKRLVHLVQEGTDRVLGHQVEADGRLVQEQQRRSVQQTCREVRPHPLAQRELAHRRVKELVELEDLAQLAEPSLE